MKILTVDAFTSRPFAGNPAAVCLLEAPADPAWMQHVAAEMNLSETTFIRPLDSGFELRWFTPEVEVDLCGHATLASARAMWSEGIVPSDQPIAFHTKSGVLTCTPRDGGIELDFPALPAEPATPAGGLFEALGIATTDVLRSKYDYLLVLEREQDVQNVAPDFRQLREIPTRGVIVTAQADDPAFDFVSRFFAPALGIDEDPVCGSAHCCLGPFWAQRLGKATVVGRQISRRTGTVTVTDRGDRVTLAGDAVVVLRGEIVAPPAA